MPKFKFETFRTDYGSYTPVASGEVTAAHGGEARDRVENQIRADRIVPGDFNLFTELQEIV
jgi:hypothetical protein